MLKVDEHILEVSIKRKLDKEYLKLVNDTSNKIYASLTYSKMLSFFTSSRVKIWSLNIS